MVATAAISAFFPAASGSSVKPLLTEGSGSKNLDVRGISSSKAPPCSGGLKVKANVQPPSMLNGTTVSLPESFKTEMEGQSQRAKKLSNQLPNWSMLLTAVTAMFLAAEDQPALLDWKLTQDDMVVDQFGLGKMVQDGLVFCQNFPIRSYEIGADRTASIQTLMNHLQETALNHCKIVGLMADGFGSTPEMSKRDLIWVIAKINILVDRYPTWGDVVQVDTYVSAAGKNGMRRDWIVGDYNTGETLARASSVCVMMNKKTRRLSKIPDEVRAELEPCFVDFSPVMDEDNRKLVKLDEETADFSRSGLTPQWNDLDVNQHVNNVKYIGWILETAPLSVLQNHELCSLTLEYRKECGRDSVLKSLTSVEDEALVEDGGVECNHMLHLESGPEIVRGRTKWRPKCSNRYGVLGQLHVQSL